MHTDPASPRILELATEAQAFYRADAVRFAQQIRDSEQLIARAQARHP